MPPESTRGQAITENLAGEPNLELGAIPTHRPAPKKSAALAKLQKAVRSKKFDFIKHAMKHFERIRDGGGAEGGHPGAAAAAQEPMSALPKRRAIAARSASSSSDNYEQPEDFPKDPSSHTLGSEAYGRKEESSSKSSRSAAARGR